MSAELTLIRHIQL